MSGDLTSHGPLQHGGQLNQIAEHYAIPIEKWLDLSTGIAPYSYPIPQIPRNIWQRLPELSPDLITSAQAYYQTPNVLPIPGSQVIIQQLPSIVAKQGFVKSTVWLPEVGYQEHAKAWKLAGFSLMYYQDEIDLSLLTPKDIVVLINPNNPSGKVYSYTDVEQLFSQVQRLKGLLIIDEAFMDCTPEQSFIGHINAPELIVLRSLGKFFGLAGIRLGFVAAAPNWLALFKAQLGPWSINGPAQYIAKKALADIDWQIMQRQQLKQQSAKLCAVLKRTFKEIPTGTSLFKTVKCIKAQKVFEQLCQQGIYVRLCDEKNALRFGIPDKNDYQLLASALERIDMEIR